jgi:hypothetical protein
MEAECKRACVEGSDLCKICQGHEELNMGGKPDKWHGRIGGPLPAASHIVGSEWNIRKRVEEAATAAKKASAAVKTVKATTAKATKAEVSAVATLASVAEKAEEEAAKATRVAAVAARKESAERHKIEAAEHKLRRITLKAGKEAAAAARKRITASRKATVAATKASQAAEKATKVATSVVRRRKTTQKKPTIRVMYSPASKVARGPSNLFSPRRPQMLPLGRAPPGTPVSYRKSSSSTRRANRTSNFSDATLPKRASAFSLKASASPLGSRVKARASASPPRPTYSERWAPATPIGSSDKSEKPNVQERIAANLTKLPELE